MITLKSGVSLVLLATVFLFLTSCKDEIKKVALSGPADKLPIESVTNLELIYSDSAKVKFKLRAPLSKTFDKPKLIIEFPRGVAIDGYDDSLHINSKLTANYAIRYEDEGRMEAMKNVVVINKKGEKLNTEHLIWDEKLHKITTLDSVRITTGDEILYGDGLEANEDFTRYRILKPKGIIYKDAKQFQ